MWVDKNKLIVSLKRIRQDGQMSDSLSLAVILALSGGLMDAYTYLFRDKVFANAQTGNILLLGIRLSEGNWREACFYLFPVLAFVMGIIVSDVLRHYFKKNTSLHWRQIAVGAECIILFAVGFLNQGQNPLANAMVSFACGIQVESFRKVNGSAAATTMCIGNLRTGVQTFCDFFFTRQKKYLKTSMGYFVIILAFVLGAVAGKEAIALFHERAVWVCSLLLLAGFVMMLKKPGKKCEKKF